MGNKYLDWHYNESVLLYNLFMFYIFILVKVKETFYVLFYFKKMFPWWI